MQKSARIAEISTKVTGGTFLRSSCTVKEENKLKILKAILKP